MQNLLINNIPDNIYQQLNTIASQHNRSLAQEVIIILSENIHNYNFVPKPSAAAIEAWLRRTVWTLPVLDNRSPETIIGYNANGLFD